LSEEEQMEKLKEIALKSKSKWMVQMKVIDTLEVFGDKAIPPITEIVKRVNDSAVKKHGLDAIKRLKEKRSPP